MLASPVEKRGVESTMISAKGTIVLNATKRKSPLQINHCHTQISGIKPGASHMCAKEEHHI
jgi:hypothetical protein